MAIYRYIVTVNVPGPARSAIKHNIAGEIDSNLESVVSTLDIEDFDVSAVQTIDAPTYAPLSPDGRYQS